jgi:Na+-driven multidrug efflux pump
MLMASEGIFRGYGDVITPWKISCIVAMLNLVLDPLLMFRGNGRWKMGLGMGIKGAAIATAFSQVCGALLYGRYLFQKRLLGGGGNANDKSLGRNGGRRAELTRQKRVIATTILRANASMMLKQGSLLLGWAYATARATRLGHTVVASHQLALSIWLVVALVLEGPAVAAQVIMAKEWEELKVLEKKAMYNNNDASDDKEQSPSVIEPECFQKQSTIKSLSLYMIKLSLIQGLLGSLAVFLLRQAAPSFILTQDPAVRRNLLTLLPHIAYQMALVSATLVTEALAIGGGRFKWLAGGTAVSSVIAMINLRGAGDLVDIWTGGIVVLFLGRLITASLAVADMNGLFSWRKSRQEKASKVP